MRIRNLCGDSETTYVYDSNAKLSRLLVKTTDGRVTKYVYGRGLIGEEINGAFKTYHFDYRGSTVAITDINGNITDRFEYDTYGKLTGRTGSSDIIFLYNGRDGVVTDGNGLIYMRARYYAPELRRFINADILAGDIANGITLNRYAYANGNPVSLIDPKGCKALKQFINTASNGLKKIGNWVFKKVENAALYLDNKYAKHTNTFDNYDNNKKYDVKDTLIDDQNAKELENLKLGNAKLQDCGCEVIAIYNAMILHGMEDVSLAETINTFEKSGLLTFQDLANGALGSNPYAISEILEEYDIPHDTIQSFDEISEPGIYVVAFWNSNDYDSMIHTITVHVSDDGEIIPYNGWLDYENQLFIAGCKIEQKTEQKTERK